MRQEHAIVFRCPSQKRLVVNAGQSDVLRSHNIEIALYAEQSTEDVVIEVLAGQPLQHGHKRKAHQ
jgi:hypothetical protein